MVYMPPDEEGIEEQETKTIMSYQAIAREELRDKNSFSFRLPPAQAMRLAAAVSEALSEYSLPD